MKVYRYEHKDTGEGPYRGDEHCVRRLCAAHRNPKTHPSPFDVGEPFDLATRPSTFESYIFGCATMGDLLYWFKGWHRRLRKAGFRIATYDVPDYNVLVGKSGQAAFVKP